MSLPCTASRESTPAFFGLGYCETLKEARMAALKECQPLPEAPENQLAASSLTQVPGPCFPSAAQKG
jgi:hypothetical protein